mmetsp:Transcript_183156/g.445894  ORF Transcript_183156/g.445894 Transcript_183156/m.445894 type:complete len:229 (+) Transcript_183156:160-846(+)
MSVCPTTPIRRSIVLISALIFVSAALMRTSGLVSVMELPRSSMLPFTSSSESCTTLSSDVNSFTAWLLSWYWSVAAFRRSCSPRYSSARWSKWELMYFSLLTRRSSMSLTSEEILRSTPDASGSTSLIVFSWCVVCSRCARHSLPPDAIPPDLSSGATRSNSVRHANGSTVATNASRCSSSSSLPSVPRTISSYITSSSSTPATSSSTSPTTSASSSTSASSAKSSSG